MTDKEEKRGNEELWRRLNQLGDLFAELAKSQAATDTHLRTLSDTVDKGFQTLSADIRHWRDRDTRPINWAGAVSAGLTLMIVISGFVLLLTRPIETDIRDLTIAYSEEQERRLEDAFWHGQFDQNLRSHSKLLEMLDERTQEHDRVLRRSGD